MSALSAAIDFQMTGTCFIISTPIGNLGDITKRAVETLAIVPMIACEDTRKTGLLLKALGIDSKARLISLYEENEATRLNEIIAFLKSGLNVALVSNAGTPTISDPGFKLVRECSRENIKVVPILGPSSPIAALSASGLPTDKFIFIGFPPPKSAQRVKTFLNIKDTLNILHATVIFFESPYRIKKSLLDLKEVFGDIEIVIAREISKVFEEFRKDKISVLAGSIKEKGEIVVLFHL